jgi:hypothetical protein
LALDRVHSSNYGKIRRDSRRTHSHATNGRDSRTTSTASFTANYAPSGHLGSDSALATEARSARGVVTFDTMAGGVYEIHPTGSTQRR